MERSPDATGGRPPPGRRYWRAVTILAAAFLVGQAMVLVQAALEREGEALRELRTEAGTIVAVLDRFATAGIAPADFGAMAEQVMSSTRLRGGVILSAQGEFMGAFGETPQLAPDLEAVRATPRIADAVYGPRYDIAWRLSDASGPYVLVLRMDASALDSFAATAPRQLMTGTLIAFLFAAVATLAVTSRTLLHSLRRVARAPQAGDAGLPATGPEGRETEIDAITRSAGHHMDPVGSTEEPR